MLQRNTEFSFSMKISKLKDKTGKIPNDLNLGLNIFYFLRNICPPLNNSQTWKSTSKFKIKIFEFHSFCTSTVTITRHLVLAIVKTLLGALITSCTSWNPPQSPAAAWGVMPDGVTRTRQPELQRCEVWASICVPNSVSNFLPFPVVLLEPRGLVLKHVEVGLSVHRFPPFKYSYPAHGQPCDF